ncbi:MAG: NifU family protein [Anaerolineales bacterium]|jgi:Fe-S cluster biogenesis protein NfuA|nr:NifU family protein [Anaerolineales bacterium]MBS3754002.1 NifU family protein [Anaerolineales bacterium]
MNENMEGHTREERMKVLISNISAYIEQYHGGSAELVSFEDDIVKVKLGGACNGCPLSTYTLKGWVEGTIKQFFPDVEVMAAD